MSRYFESYPVSPGVLVNIDMARALTRGRRPNGRLYVPVAKKCVDKEYAGLNKRYAARGKLKKEPVIMIAVGGVWVLVDGWHRAWRASRQGKTFLPAYKLTDAEAKRVCFPLGEYKSKGER